MTKEDRKRLESAAAYINKDFRLFFDYIEEKKVKVSKRDLCMKNKDCFILDGQMHFQEKYADQKYPQEYYAVIQFFSFFGQRFGIWRLQEHSRTLFKYEKGKNYELFRKLSDRSRYLLFLVCFLYEYAGAVKMDIPIEGGGTHEILRFFAKKDPGAVIENTPEVRGIFFEEWVRYTPVLRIFQELGLCVLELEQADGWQKIVSIKITEAGCAAGRWFQKCDMLLKIQMEEEYYDPWEYIGQAVPVYGRQFVSEERFLVQGFFAAEEEECIYSLVVSLRNCIRTIRINGDTTLERLHLMIQEAFAFENDHFYYFSVGHAFGSYNRKT